MTPAIAALARFLLQTRRQFVTSGVAIVAFTWAFGLPPELPWLHLVSILALQTGFSTCCGLAISIPAVGRNRCAPYAYATLLAVKFVAVDLLYVVSFATYSAWGDNLSRENLRALLPHLAGFREAFGVWIYAALGTLALLLGASYALVLRSRERLLHSLRARWPERRHRWVAPVFTVYACVIAGGAWFAARNPQQSLRADPVLSFWYGQGELTESVFSDNAARADYPAAPEFRRRNIFVFSIDCMRADHLPLFGYPRETTPYLTSLQAAGRLQPVPFAVAVGNNSSFGIFGLLASRYVEGLHPSNFTMQEVLKKLGYRTYLIGAGDHTSFEEMARYYGPSFDLHADGLSARSYTVNDDRGVLETLESVPAFDGQPAFFFFHLMSAHTLGVHDPKFDLWNPRNGNRKAVVSRRERAIAAYDAGLRQADAVMEAMFKILEEKGYLHDYVGAVCGDHGEGLGERDHYGHTRYLHAEDVAIPLLFLDSETPPPVRHALASQVDIAPTLFARLGLPAPSSWVGVDLATADQPRTVFLTGKRDGPWRGLVSHDGGHLYKYLFVRSRTGELVELLFDVATDPSEHRDLMSSAPAALVTTLRQAAANHFKVALPSR